MDPNRIGVTIAPNPSEIYEGGPITVTVIYTMPVITPLMQGLLEPHIVIRAQAVQIALEANPR